MLAADHSFGLSWCTKQHDQVSSSCTWSSAFAYDQFQSKAQTAVLLLSVHARAERSSAGFSHLPCLAGSRSGQLWYSVRSQGLQPAEHQQTGATCPARPNSGEDLYMHRAAKSLTHHGSSGFSLPGCCMLAAIERTSASQAAARCSTLSPEPADGQWSRSGMAQWTE